MREWLKKARQEKGITQQEFAEMLGMNQQTYSMIERGERQKVMGVTLAAKISSLLKIPFTYIIDAEVKNCGSVEELGAAREFIQEDGNGICDQYAESVSNISQI